MTYRIDGLILWPVKIDPKRGRKLGEDLERIRKRSEKDQKRIRIRSGKDQWRIRVRSGSAQERIRRGSGED